MENKLIHSTLFKLVKKTDTNSNYVDNMTLYLNDPDEFDECVFMTSHMFKEIFGQTWSTMSQEKKLLPIVKITYQNYNIYRRYRQCSAKDLKKYQIGLTQRSISLLCSEKTILGSNQIQLSVGNEHDFFTNHPNHATRMSYKMSLESNKLGKFSIAIGIYSVIISIVSLILAFK